jgi:SAM-dependent methyltransferase
MHAAPTRLARRRGDLRSEDQLREHYRIERELANRLREASRAERRTLYTLVYEELLQRVPHHPRRTTARDAAFFAHRKREADWLLRFLERFISLRTRFLEVGAGDCALALRVSDLAEHVVAVDVCDQACGERPCNFELALSDGCSIPVRDGSIDVAFSNQMMEHLHPDDAREQLVNIFRSLAPGGTYVCITPNRLYGPRDVSGYFDEIATGLHLREYSAREVREMLLAVGFERVDFYLGGRGWYVRCPGWIVAGVEMALEALPAGVRKQIADTALLRALLGVRVAAIKPGDPARQAER